MTEVNTEDHESEFLTFAKIVDKLVTMYYKLLDEEGIDGAYYPIRITIWVVNPSTFRPIKKLVEIDEREGAK